MLYLRKKVKYKKNRIIIFYEDSGYPTVFLADTPERYYEAFLNKLEELNKWVLWHDPEKPSPPEVTREQAELLPEGKVKGLAIKELKSYELKLKNYKYQKELDEMRKRAIRTRNGRIAEAVIIESGMESLDIYILIDPLEEDEN